jgi:hypothetical protein
MTNMEPREDVGSGLVRDAVFTFVVVVIAVLALDDITTDSAPSFAIERTALTGCAVWFFMVARRLWHRGHRVLGGVSFGLVTIGALAQPTIGPDTVPTEVGYLATVGALAWFLIVAGILTASTWRARHSHPA